jgi:NADPH2:quinone reductase
MRAVRVHEFGGPEVLRIEEVPDPSPGPGQVLVRLRAAGVNTVDAYIRTGTYARRPELPYVPGGDGAGDVAAVGAGVERFRPGQRVYVAAHGGAYAEMAVVSQDEVWPLPDRVTYEQGAAVGVPYATAYRAILQRGSAQPGEWLLVHGASGGVGTAAVQIGAAHGLRVVATAGSPEGLAHVAAQGAEHALDHTDPDHLTRAVELTGGRGFDVIVEMRADLHLARDLRALAMGGRVVVVGSRGSIEVNPRDAMGREAAVLGMLLFNADPRTLAQIHAALGAGLANGSLRPVVGRRLPLAEAGAAHEAVMAPGALGKIVLVP